ncbi:MAG: hypothetical protein ABI035_03740 [Gemmatimonadaceae bacterium]
MIFSIASRTLVLLVALAACDAPSSVAGACRHRIGIGSGDVSAALNTRTSEERTVQGDAQTCQFVISGPTTVDVSVRPGMGRVTVSSWIRGRMPLAAAAVNGVGDYAVWQPQLRELIAEQNDLLCDVTLSADNTKESADSVRDRAGALCTMVFASARNANTPVAGNHSTRR